MTDRPGPPSPPGSSGSADDHDAAVAAATLPEVRVVDRFGDQDRLLLLVHGYAEPPEVLTRHLDTLDPDGRYLAVCPVAPFDKAGAPVWHRALSGESARPVAQYLRSLALLDELVEQLCADRGLDRGQAVFAGFSQGAGLAVGLTLNAGRRGRPAPAGCLSFCGFAPPIRGLEVDLGTAAGVPLLQLSSTDDPFVPLTSSRHSADALAELGLAVTYHELDQGHEITDEGAALAARWLAEVTAGGRPTSGRPAVAVNPLLDWVRALWA